jgi:hypothetical protein
MLQLCYTHVLNIIIIIISETICMCVCMCLCACAWLTWSSAVEKSSRNVKLILNYVFHVQREWHSCECLPKYVLYCGLFVYSKTVV